MEKEGKREREERVGAEEKRDGDYVHDWED